MNFYQKEELNKKKKCSARTGSLFISVYAKGVVVERQRGNGFFSLDWYRFRRTLPDDGGGGGGGTGRNSFAVFDDYNYTILLLLFYIYGQR